MARPGPFRTLSPDIGNNLYRATNMAELLDAEDFKDASTELLTAATIIEGRHQTGREKYLKHFKEMGFLRDALPRKNLSSREVTHAAKSADILFVVHEQILHDAHRGASILQETFPNLLYRVQQRARLVPGTLQKVTGFNIEIAHGDVIPHIRPTFESPVALTGSMVALCDVTGFNAEMQAALTPHLLELEQ